MKCLPLLSCVLVFAILIPAASEAAATGAQRECGTDRQVILDSPFEQKAVRKTGQTDAELVGDVVDTVRKAWEGIQDCAECGVEDGCVAFASFTYSSADVLPNPSEPDVTLPRSCRHRT